MAIFGLNDRSSTPMHRSRRRSIIWFSAAALFLIISVALAMVFLRDRPIRLFDRMPIRSNNIVFFGDSHIEFFDAAGMLNDRRIRNRGFSGETSRDLLPRAEEITRAGPQKVLLLAGANDVFQGRSMDQYLSDMRALIATIRARAGELIVITIPPSSNKAVQRRIDEFNGSLRDLCNDHDVRLIDLDPVLVQHGILDTALTEDGVHLNEEGYRRILPLLKPSLERNK